MEIISEADAAVLYPALDDVGANVVSVEFAGSGDSGSIESVTAYAMSAGKLDEVRRKNSVGWYQPDIPTCDIDAPKIMRSVRRTKYDTEKKVWVDETSEKVVSIKDVIEDICYQALDRTNLDWYNNDGGQGDFLFIKHEDGTWSCRLDVYVNVVSIESFHFS